MVERNYFKTKNNNLEYRLIGNREGESAVIMFPGFGCHSDFCFDEITRELSEDHNLFLFNHPTHGFSEGSLRIPEMQESVYEIVQEIGRYHNHIGGLGHSLGAYILGSGMDKSSSDALVLIGVPVTMVGVKVSRLMKQSRDLPYSMARWLFRAYDKARLITNRNYRISNMPYRSREDKCDAYFGAIKMTKDIFEDINLLRSNVIPVYGYGNAPPDTLLIYGSNENCLGYTISRMEDLKREFGRECSLAVIPLADHNLNITRRSGKLGLRESGVVDMILEHYRKRFK